MAAVDQISNMYRLKVPERLEQAENTPHDVILSFDTTTSMVRFIQKLRDDLQEFITSIFDKHPETRIAVSQQGHWTSLDVMGLVQNFINL